MLQMTGHDRHLRDLAQAKAVKAVHGDVRSSAIRNVAIGAGRAVAPLIVVLLDALPIGASRPGSIAASSRTTTTRASRSMSRRTIFRRPPGRGWESPWGAPTPASSRLGVLLAALLALVVKLALASSTGGTQDVQAWAGFAAGVRQRGPVGVYGIDFVLRNGTMYNHPPLVGYYLQVLNLLEQRGIPLALSLRAAASAADVVCALLVFEIVRRRRSPRSAMVAGIIVAASPILILVSGYHGNTDPIVMMLLWLGCFLIIDRRMAALGAIAVGLAIGVKLVPVIALPALAAWLIRSGDRRLMARAATGFTLTIAVTWGPAILLQWRGLRANVLGYSGIPDRPWGLVKLADAYGATEVTTWLVGPGRFAVLLVCAAVPAVCVWMRPLTSMEWVAIGMASFLVLSPAFGVQYLAWAVAASVLLDARAAALYNVFGGLLLFDLYTHWNRGLDWTGVAPGQPFNPAEVVFAWVVWMLLIVVVHRGLRREVLPGPARRR